MIRLVLMIVICSMGYSCEKEDHRQIQDGMESSFTKKSMRVSGQDIDIYLPPDYDPEVSHPVIYFNDGERYFYVFNQLTFDYPEPFIMVGLHAGSNRNNKYLPYDDLWIQTNWGDYNPRAQEYSQLIIEEIIPAVEHEYSVDPNRRAIFGISLGGLHAGWIALKYPEYFSFSAAISPSFWSGDYAIFDEPMEGLTQRNLFYVDIGTSEWNYYIPFINRLKEAGLAYGKQVFYYEVEGGVHSTISWGDRINVPFELFINQGQLPGEPSYNLAIECIPSQRTAGLYFQRLNPMISYGNGVKFSLTTEAKYEILSGDGVVTDDGQFKVNSGVGIKVKVSYESWSESVDLQNCH